MDVKNFLTYFNEVRKTGNNQYMVKCPCHDDKKASLSITEKDNKILMHCFAGCKTKDILAKVNLIEKDLFNDKQQELPKVIKQYIYKDEDNKPLHRVVRIEPKDFIQFKYENGKWINKMDGTRYVPYNLPNILKSNIIYWVEGEKDADNLNSLGLVATTTVSGANGFKKRAEEYIQYFKEKIVYIIPDNDEPGRKYACDVMQTLKQVAKQVKILDLSKEIPDLLPKSDISDVLKKYGKDRTLEIIDKLKQSADFSLYIGQRLNLQMMENILKELNIFVGYNEITKETEVKGLSTKYSEDSSTELLPALLNEFCIANRIKYKERDIKNELLLISDSNTYNPIQDMLTKNKWDGQDRFQILFEIVGITNDKLSQILLRKWMYQTAMIVFNGKNEIFGTEGVLVFQGKQDAGKTRFIRNLALKLEWFKEGAIIDLNSKDSIIEATKGWIVELGELDHTLKKKQSALKAFLTNTMDEVRLPYGQKSTKKPRRTSFFASVNPNEFLIDETGNRRYWTIPVENINNERLERLGKDFIMQLWIQSYNEIKDTPQKFRLTQEEKEALNKRNNNYSEFIQCEEEITLRMDFSGKTKEKWTTVEINEEIFDGKISATVIGRAINKIHSKYPEFVSIEKTSNGRRYILPIKRNTKEKSKK